MTDYLHRQLFEEWWKQYLSEGGRSHFNINADEESAWAAWQAVIAKLSAKEGTRDANNL